MRIMPILGWSLVTLAAGLAGCAKKPAEQTATPPPAEAPALPLVTDKERSKYFEAVNRRLELGGTLYGYVDIDGDALKLAAGLQQFIGTAAAQNPQAAAFVPKDFGPIFQDLGFTDVTAFGISSVQAEDGSFRNRVFFHTPNGRHGLLAGLGGPPAPFVSPKIAPGDADFVYEAELDLPAVYAAVRAVVARVAGAGMADTFEAKLTEADPESGLIPLDLINKLKGRVCVIARIDDTRSFQPSPELTLPAVDVLVRIEGVGLVLESVLAKIPELKKNSAAAGVTIYTFSQAVPKVGWTPEFRIEGDSLTFASVSDFAVGKESTLATNEVFKRALASLGETGNGLTYVSPSLADRVRRLETLNPELLPAHKQMLETLLRILPETGASPLVSIRENLPDGILFRSHWSASHKANLMLANPGAIATTGLLAAMAIPAFQKVRVNSQQKAVTNNLRQLAAAADQYFLESGKTVCGYRDLVGTEPNAYIRDLKPVLGEDYTKLLFRQGQPRITVTLSNGVKVTHDWNP